MIWKRRKASRRSLMTTPEMTMEQLMQFKRMNRESRVKPTVSLRISPATLEKAKRYGKGYTGLLSRLPDGRH